MSFILVERQSDGKIINHVIGSFESLQVGIDSTYTVINNETGKVAENIVLKRKDDQLEILVDDETVAIIDGFYADDIVSGFSPDASFSDSTLLSNTAITDANSQAVVWSQNDADSGLSNTTWGIIGGAAVAGGAVASNSSDDDNNNYNVTIDAAAGPFESTVIVELYDNQGNLLASKEHDFSTGPVTFTIENGYVGPVLAKVIDANGEAGDYRDETSNELTNLGEPLRAIGEIDGSGDIQLTITPLTELAVRQAGIVDIPTTDNPLTEEALAANEEIGRLFGVEDITGPVITVLDQDYNPSDSINAQEHYGEVLAVLSGIDASSGSTHNSLTQLESLIQRQDNGGLVLNQQGAALLAEGIETFSESENGASVDLSTFNLGTPVISVDGPLGNINDGVSVTAYGVSVGDVVTVKWGSEIFTFTVGEGDLNVNDNGETLNSVDIIVPSSVIEAAGNGDVFVTFQVENEPESPASIVTVDLTSPLITSNETIT